jgi:hypothetical protein
MQVIPFESSQLPAHIRTGKPVVNPFAAAMSTGFPALSIKGKVFHIVRGDEKTLVTKPDNLEEPASSLEVVIVAGSPVLTKTYYRDGFKEGSADKPTCYSDDGIAPAKDAQEAQAKKCAVCQHNAWGSGVNDKGEPTKGKACADVLRLAVVPAGQLNDPMLLRVPAASLRAIGAYGDTLAKRGVEPKHVVTRVGFDYSVAHPALTFKALRFVEAEELTTVEATAKEDIVQRIIGAAPSSTADAAFDTPVPEPAPKKSADAPAKPSAKLEEAVAKAETAPTKKAKVKVETEEDEAPAPAKKAPVTVDDIEQALDDLDFDD